MSRRLRYDLVETTLGAQLNAAATTITFASPLTSAQGNVATITSPEYLPLVIEDEILYLTAYTESATTGTVLRGQEGTTDATHNNSTPVVHGPTVHDFGGAGPLSIEWLIAVWASDPDWVNPGNGNPVSMWRDITGKGMGLTQATAANRPTYVSSGINGLPSVQGDGTNDQLTSPVFSSISQTYSLVAVGTNPSADNIIVSAGTLGNTGFVGRETGGGTWRLFAGGAQPTFGSTTTPALIGGVFDGGSSKGIYNDTVTTSLSTGSNPGNGLNLFSRAEGDNRSSGQIAFAGIYVGDITEAPGWDRFLAWVNDLYALW